MGTSIDQVHGVIKDDNNALIRLADTWAGCVHDALASDYPEAIAAV